MPLIETIGSGSSRSYGLFGRKPVGLVAAEAAFSAKEIYESGITQNGNYWVKGKGSTPRQVYCLMDRMGGGWTRVMRIQRDYNYAQNNFYTYNVGSSFDSSVNSTFNLAANLFGNTNGTDLSVMYRVVGSTSTGGGPFPGYMGGAIWRGVYLDDAWNDALDSGSLRTTTTQYSLDGINFTNLTQGPLGKANSSWNLVHASFADANLIGHYAYPSQASGFILGHGGGLGSNYAQQNYGYIENQGNVGGESTWSYVDVYIRKDL